jgi:hypothetical protein
MPLPITTYIVELPPSHFFHYQQTKICGLIYSSDKLAQLVKALGSVSKGSRFDPALAPSPPTHITVTCLLSLPGSLIFVLFLYSSMCRCLSLSSRYNAPMSGSSMIPHPELFELAQQVLSDGLHILKLFVKPLFLICSSRSIPSYTCAMILWIHGCPILGHHHFS